MSGNRSCNNTAAKRQQGASVSPRHASPSAKRRRSTSPSPSFSNGTAAKANGNSSSNGHHHTDSPSHDESGKSDEIDGCGSEVASSDSGIFELKSVDEVDAIKNKRQLRAGAKKKRVTFNTSEVFHFQRAQGWICVPTDNGPTLGMSFTHVSKSEVDVDDDKDVPSSQALKPIGMRGRKLLLRESSIDIDKTEKSEYQHIRISREVCGCRCPMGKCDHSTCICAKAGTPCQVDRPNFPCSCSADGCGNASGRIEFNLWRVRTHLLHTLLREHIAQSPPPTDGIIDSSFPSSTCNSPSFNSTLFGTCKDCVEIFDKRRELSTKAQNLELLDELEQLYTKIKR